MMELEDSDCLDHDSDDMELDSQGIERDSNDTKSDSDDSYIIKRRYWDDDNISVCPLDSDDLDSDCVEYEDFYRTRRWKAESGPKSAYKFKRRKSDLLELKNKHLKGIAGILQELCGESLNFFVEDELCCQDITMKVEGIGDLSFPLKDDCIENLISLCTTKARFEKGEETIVSENGCGAHKIPGKTLNVKINHDSFTHMLDKMRSEMGFSENCVLETELHCMDISGRNRFFEFHEDSEKVESVVGTLVIMLPSPHVGGDLIIQHSTKVHTFSSENVTYTNFKCIGFSVDCKHNIKKVKDGFRIALTYKLILKTKNNKSVDYVTTSLKVAIQNYSGLSQKNKYVYFLDHCYTEESLKWNMLKGEDYIRSKALLAIAKSLVLPPYLTFVKVKHSWKNRHNSQREDPIPINLCEVHYSLYHWVNSNNEISNKMFFHECSVTEEEICWTKETSAAFEPYASDCKGYTGTDGITVNYWYQRAAVVLCPNTRLVPFNLILNHDLAFKELKAIMETRGKENEVKEILKLCGNQLYSKCKVDRPDFEKMTRIALYIDDKQVSMPLLSHFNWSILDYDISKSLAKLESQYGSTWCIKLLKEWRGPEDKPRSTYTNNTIKKLNKFVKIFLDCGGTSMVVEIILCEQFRNISNMKNFEQYSSTMLKDALVEYVKVLYEFIISCTLIENMDLINNVIQYLVSSSFISQETYFIDLYLKLRKDIPTRFFIYCEPLKIYFISLIQAKLKSEIKSLSNWSMDQLLCSCEYCQEVNSFLRSKTEKKKEWELHQTYLNHVKSKLKSLKLPVTLSFEDNCRPLKMTLVKNKSLHSDNRKRIEKFELILKNLQSDDTNEL